MQVYGNVHRAMDCYRRALELAPQEKSSFYINLAGLLDQMNFAQDALEVSVASAGQPASVPCISCTHAMYDLVCIIHVMRLYSLQLRELSRTLPRSCTPLMTMVLFMHACNKPETLFHVLIFNRFWML